MRLLCVVILVIYNFGCDGEKVDKISDDISKVDNSDQDAQSSKYVTGLNTYDGLARNYGNFDSYSAGRNNLNNDRGETYADLVSRDYDRYDDDKDDYGQYRNQRYQRRYDEPLDERTIKQLDRIFGYTGPTANDEPENLIRPCAFEDWQCIRKYFAANSQCQPAYGPIPDPFYIEKNTIFLPVANTTVTIINVAVRGLSSAKINDFYINRKSGNLVFAIDVQNLNLSIPRAYVRYRRAALESIVLADEAFVNFRTATLTAVLGKVPKLRLDDADIHLYSNEQAAENVYGPGIYSSTDPAVIEANARYVALFPISIREVIVLLAPLITGKYIQDNICDFGLKLISL